MVAWTISLLGIVVITLICDVILPDGQTSKYIKTAISVIVVCAMILPMFNVFNGGKVDFTPTYKTFESQSGYLDFVASKKQKTFEDELLIKLSKEGYVGCEVIVEIGANLEVEFVTVEIPFKFNCENSLIKIKEIVSSVCNVCVDEVSCSVKD